MIHSVFADDPTVGMMDYGHKNDNNLSELQGH